MPLKLCPPDKKHPTWRVRGTHYGVNVDRSTGASQRKNAQKLLIKWTEEIERGVYARPQDPTFSSAALSYMQAGGERTYLAPLIEHFGDMKVVKINQAAIDAAAVKLYPDVTDASRNRWVYTPVSAVLRHAGIKLDLNRPKGADGTKRTAWLKKPEAAALFDAARNRADRLAQEAEAVEGRARGAAVKAARAARRFTALCVFLLYSGCRLSEALRMKPRDVELDRSFCYCGKTKNGLPRAVHLTPDMVAEFANIEFGEKTVFGVSAKCGRLYTWLDEIATAAGVEIPERVAFHIFRHTYGAWMRRHAGLDTSGLVGTGAWRSRNSAAVYEHVETTEEARKADLLPTLADLGEIREKRPERAKK